MNLLDNARNQQFKCNTENWATIKHGSQGTYNEVMKFIKLDSTL